MIVKLQRSTLDLHIFEVWEEDVLVSEISVTFPLKKIPSSFVSLQAMHQWLQEIEKKMAQQSAYGSLTLRNHASQELCKKLERKGFSAAVCQEVMVHLQSCGLLQDEEFTNGLIQRELRTGHGPRYIEAKLRFQGLDATKVRKIVTSEKQQEVLSKLIRKKSKSSIASLLRRGFDFEVIKKVLD